jgi:flavin-dependent dehydrogenase
MPTSPFHVIIVGAGTGGLALAQGLKRAGISVAVYERDRPAPTDCRATGSASTPTASAPCAPICRRSCITRFWQAAPNARYMPTS